MPTFAGKIRRFFSTLSILLHLEFCRQLLTTDCYLQHLCGSVNVYCASRLAQSLPFVSVKMSEGSAPKKRSRFDQTEPEPRKVSRFDRRSRSPVSRHSESRRSRSPLSKSARSPSTDSKPKTPIDPAAAAAAAAAKINAQIEARRGIQHVDVPPIQSATTSAAVPPKSPTPANNSTSKLDGDIYIADGDYIKDIEVNDLRNRYTLTKGSTQKMVITPCSMLILQALCSSYLSMMLFSFKCARICQLTTLLI